MKFAWLFMFVVFMAGCCQKQEQQSVEEARSPAVQLTSPEARKPFETAPLVVDSGSISEQDPAVLAAAEWTRKQCSLNVNNDEKEVSHDSGRAVQMSGFFIAPNDQPAGNFDIVLKGKEINYVIPAKTGWDRTDVAHYFNQPQLDSSGYDVHFVLPSNVHSGRYEVNFMVELEGKNFFCESGKVLLVE